MRHVEGCCSCPIRRNDVVDAVSAPKEWRGQQVEGRYPNIEREYRRFEEKKRYTQLRMRTGRGRKRV
jgi:hypothetical protein